VTAQAMDNGRPLDNNDEAMTLTEHLGELRRRILHSLAALAAGTLGYLVKELASEYEMRVVMGWKTFLISTLLTFCVSLVVSLFVAKKNKKIDMVEALKDQLKQYMNENQLETLAGDEHKATYKTVTSSRIDTAALKKGHPDIATQYTKTTETKRFTFA